MIKNFFLHLNTVNKHRFLVFKLCCKAGVPFRGLVHDLSKYNPVEFLEGVKYYQGTYSPISKCKKEEGYSKAWLHHKGRNKHHYQYWYDHSAPEPNPVIPYKYTVEMICDTLAAGITYQKSKWTSDYQLNYYLRERQKNKINENIDQVLLEVYEKVRDEGIDNTINSKTLKKIYNKYVGDKNEKGDKKS